MCLHIVHYSNYITYIQYLRYVYVHKNWSKTIFRLKCLARNQFLDRFVWSRTYKICHLARVKDAIQQFLAEIPIDIVKSFDIEVAQRCGHSKTSWHSYPRFRLICQSSCKKHTFSTILEQILGPPPVQRYFALVDSYNLACYLSCQISCRMTNRRRSIVCIDISILYLKSPKGKSGHLTSPHTILDS